MRFSEGDSCELKVKISDQLVQTFADLSGDFNPVHMDSQYAETTPAGGRVVHGMLLCAYVSQLIGMELPGKGALWSKFEVDFLGKVRLGDEFSLQASVTHASPATRTLDLRIAGFRNSGEKVLAARARVMDLESDDCPISPKVVRASHAAQTVSEKVKISSEGLVAREGGGRQSGYTTLITGATGVLGRSVALSLAARGDQLILWGRNDDKLKALRAEVSALSERNHLLAQVQMESSADIHAAIDEAVARVEKIDRVVHLAHPPTGNFKVMDPEFPELLEGHLQGAVLGFSQLMSRVLPMMSRQKYGRVVAVLSEYILDAPPEKLGAYVAAKSAIWGIIKSMAVEMGPVGIRANAISPGMINTPYSAQVPVRFKQLEEAMNPSRRLCLPADIVAALTFLLSDESSFINGVNLPITGGKKMS